MELWIVLSAQRWHTPYVEIDLNKIDELAIELGEQFRRAINNPNECLQFSGGDASAVRHEKSFKKPSGNLSVLGKLD